MFHMSQSQFNQASFSLFAYKSSKDRDIGSNKKTEKRDKQTEREGVGGSKRLRTGRFLFILTFFISFVCCFFIVEK